MPEAASDAEKPKPKRATIQRKKPAQALKEQAEREAQEPAEEPETTAPSEDAVEAEPAPEEATEPPQEDAPMALVAPEDTEPFVGNPLGLTREEREEFGTLPENFR